MQYNENINHIATHNIYNINKTFAKFSSILLVTFIINLRLQKQNEMIDNQSSFILQIKTIMIEYITIS